MMICEWIKWMNKYEIYWCCWKSRNVQGRTPFNSFNFFSLRLFRMGRMKKLKKNWRRMRQSTAPTKSTLHSINKEKLLIFLFWFHEVDWFLLANGGPTTQINEINLLVDWPGCLFSLISFQQSTNFFNN